jgi:hypothetical protein
MASQQHVRGSTGARPSGVQTGTEGKNRRNRLLHTRIIANFID